MNELVVIGYVVTAVITLGAFIGIIMKFVQPINELRLVIQELKDAITHMREDDGHRDARIKQQGEDITKLDGRVSKLETKIGFYHPDNN